MLMLPPGSEGSPEQESPESPSESFSVIPGSAFTATGPSPAPQHCGSPRPSPALHPDHHCPLRQRGARSKPGPSPPHAHTLP